MCHVCSRVSVLEFLILVLDVLFSMLCCRLFAGHWIVTGQNLGNLKIAENPYKHLCKPIKPYKKNQLKPIKNYKNILKPIETLH